MKVLFLTHPYPNYVPDLLLHGLRKLIGPDVVDFPRKDCLYQGVLGLGVCPPDQLCPGWFPEDDGAVDREDIETKIRSGYFGLVACDLRAWAACLPRLAAAGARVALIDGEDRPARIPPGNYVVFRRETDGCDYSIPLPMALPEEIFNWIVSYDHLPKRYSVGFLGSTHDGRRRDWIAALAGRFSDCLFSASAVPSAEHPSPQGRLGRDAYYRELQQCRFVLSLAGAGLDTFRFWENAACSAVHVAERFALSLPDPFEDRVSLVRFGGFDELLRSIEALASDEEACRRMVLNGRQQLYQRHLTTSRAHYFVERALQAFGA